MPDPLKPVNQSTQPLWLSSCSLSRRWTAPSCHVIFLELALGSVAVGARLCTRCGDARQRVERTESGCRGTREVSFIQELLERIGCLGSVHGLCCAKRDELIVPYTEFHKRLRCALAPHFDRGKTVPAQDQHLQSPSMDRTCCLHVRPCVLMRTHALQHSMLTCAVGLHSIPFRSTSRNLCPSSALQHTS